MMYFDPIIEEACEQLGWIRKDFSSAPDAQLDASRDSFTSVVSFQTAERIRTILGTIRHGLAMLSPLAMLSTPLTPNSCAPAPPPAPHPSTPFPFPLLPRPQPRPARTFVEPPSPPFADGVSLPCSAWPAAAVYMDGTVSDRSRDEVVEFGQQFAMHFGQLNETCRRFFSYISGRVFTNMKEWRSVLSDFKNSVLQHAWGSRSEKQAIYQQIENFLLDPTNQKVVAINSGKKGRTGTDVSHYLMHLLTDASSSLSAKCVVCKSTAGIFVKCSQQRCTKTFHIFCAAAVTHCKHPPSDYYRCREHAGQFAAVEVTTTKKKRSRQGKPPTKNKKKNKVATASGQKRSGDCRHCNAVIAAMPTAREVQIAKSVEVDVSSFFVPEQTDRIVMSTAASEKEGTSLETKVISHAAFWTESKDFNVASYLSTRFKAKFEEHANVRGNLLQTTSHGDDSNSWTKARFFVSSNFVAKVYRILWNPDDPNAKTIFPQALHESAATVFVCRRQKWHCEVFGVFHQGTNAVYP